MSVLKSCSRIHAPVFIRHESSSRYCNFKNMRDIVSSRMCHDCLLQLPLRSRGVYGGGGLVSAQLCRL